MKIGIILLLSVFLSMGSWGKKGQIEVSFQDSRTNKRALFRKSGDVRIKSETGKVYGLFITKKGYFSDKLEEGNYELEFESVFRRKEIERFQIGKGERKKLTIFINKFTSDLEPIKQRTVLDTILIGEEYQITFKSQGCFHFFEDSIKISRQETGYFIVCEQGKTKMSDNQIATIRDFELKLWNNRMAGGCTTIDTYGIKYRNEHFLVSLDGTCNWRGFTAIKDKINNELCGVKKEKLSSEIKSGYNDN